MGEVGVGRAEVVTPFGDAVGFVDGDAGELTLGVNSLEVAAEGFRECEFRGNVQESGKGMTLVGTVGESFAIGFQGLRTATQII